MKAAGLGALNYQASVLEAYMSLGLVTAVGPSHDRSAYTFCFQHCDMLSVVEYNSNEQTTTWIAMAVFHSIKPAALHLQMSCSYSRTHLVRWSSCI